MCHFTRQGLDLLLYLNSVKAKSPNSLQLLALTHISILAGGLKRLILYDWLASKMSDWVPRLEEWKVVFLYKLYKGVY